MLVDVNLLLTPTKLVRTTQSQIMKQLEAILKANGPDGRYALIADGVSGYQPWKSDDTYVIQASHETAKHIYKDMLHISAEAGQKYKSIVHAFSHSQDVINGNFAYGDYGQNYKVTE